MPPLHEFTPTILTEALQRFGMQLVAELEGFDSHVYECRQGDQACVLKIVNAARHAQAELEGELDFVLYLADRGIPVVHPVASSNNQYIEKIGLAQGFLASASEKAPGIVLPDEDDINLPEPRLNALLFEWGRLMGKLHCLAKDYRPASPHLRRMEWHQEQQVWDVEKHLPAQRALAKQKINALYHKFAALPTGPQEYGLIHCDLHHGNFSIDEHVRLTIFDFGSCMYSWFILDIAVALYYALPYPPSREAERRAFAPRFLQHFASGYQSENHLDPGWFVLLPDFLKYEQIASYVLFHQIWDLAQLSEKRAAALERHRLAIENDVPVVDFDFSAWSAAFFAQPST